MTGLACCSARALTTRAAKCRASPQSFISCCLPSASRRNRPPRPLSELALLSFLLLHEQIKSTSRTKVSPTESDRPLAFSPADPVLLTAVPGAPALLRRTTVARLAFQLLRANYPWPLRLLIEPYGTHHLGSHARAGYSRPPLPLRARMCALWLHDGAGQSGRVPL